MYILETAFDQLTRWDLNAVQAEIFRLEHPSFLPLADCVKDASVMVRPFDSPTKMWPIYGVNNVDGVVFSHHQSGEQFRQPYKRIREGWFVHNPTRANVGSFGRAPAVEDDALTSPDYQVWQISDGYLPEFMEIILRTQAFRYLVSIHRVGAVKRRLFLDNLREIVLPRPPLEVQSAMVAKYNTAIAEANALRSQANQLLQSMAEQILQRLSLPAEYLEPKPTDGSIMWEDMDRWDFPFYRRDFVLLEEWLSDAISSRSLAEAVTFRVDGWTEHDFPSGAFQYIEIGDVKPLEGIVQSEPIDVSEAPDRARYKVHQGDILVATTRPYLGKIARVSPAHDDAVCSSGFSVISGCANDVDMNFLLLVLQSPIVLRQLERRMSGGSYPAITQLELEKVRIPVPDATVQLELVQLVAGAKNAAIQNQSMAKAIEADALIAFEQLISG